MGDMIAKKKTDSSRVMSIARIRLASTLLLVTDSDGVLEDTQTGLVTPHEASSHERRLYDNNISQKSCDTKRSSKDDYLFDILQTCKSRKLVQPSSKPSISFIPSKISR